MTHQLQGKLWSLPSCCLRHRHGENNELPCGMEEKIFSKANQRGSSSEEARVGKDSRWREHLSESWRRGSAGIQSPFDGDQCPTCRGSVGCVKVNQWAGFLFSNVKVVKTSNKVSNFGSFIKHPTDIYWTLTMFLGSSPFKKKSEQDKKKNDQNFLMLITTHWSAYVVDCMMMLVMISCHFLRVTMYRPLCLVLCTG